MARLIRVGEFVGRGERKAAEYLERQLPPSWVVICNKELVLPDSMRREVDFIIVGDHAVFACEEKSWDGAIHGNEDAWVLRSGESFPSPIRRTEFAAKRLAGMLRDQVAHLRASVAVPFVFGRVILTADEVKIFVRDPGVADHVLNLTSCDKELQRIDRLQANIGSIKPFHKAIVERLTALSDRPRIPRQVGEYEVVETVSASPHIRTLRARHRDGSERLLRLFSRQTTENAEIAKKHEQALLREYETIGRLAQTGRVPGIDPYFSWDQDSCWVVPIHPVQGRSLRADRTDAPPTEDRAWAVLIDSFQALSEIHSCGVVHRSISPDRVFLCAGDRVCFTDFIIARLSDASTVAGLAGDLDPEESYRAPECRVDLGLAEFTSDVFSLAASLGFWLTGAAWAPDDDEDPAEAVVVAKVRELLGESMSALFQECLLRDERMRPSAANVVERLRELRRQARRPPSPPPMRDSTFEEGQVVAGQYRIVRLLGRGSTAATYLAEDQEAESLFVLKVLRNPETARELARAEFKSLMGVVHPNLPRVFDIRPPQDEFHIKTEYIPSTALGNLPPEAWNEPGLFWRVANGVLRALACLEQHNIVHRDLSPNNILVPDDKTAPVKLIDFGLATSGEHAKGAVGTRRYRAPEVDRGGSWTHRADLYSAGVVLFELLTGRLPYLEDERLRKDELVKPTADERILFGDELLAVLQRAAEPEPRARQASAEEFLEELEAAMRARVPPVPEGQMVVNPVVDALRRQFRDSRIGNADNRGLDSQFAIDTYVETGLDRELLPLILDGRYRLVILSGNPGDGKTAFLQRVRQELAHRGATEIRSDPTGWVFGHKGRRYAALYDASESHEGHSADELIRGVLGPLEGKMPTETRYTALIAVNDGRLLSFFEAQASWYPWLWESIRGQLYGEGPANAEVVLVDLKKRSLVDHSPSGHCLFRGIIEQFLAAERWRDCASCSARDACPILFNVKSLSDQASADNTRAQLHSLLLAAHLRRERRATIRDLRSALGFLITHNLGCNQVHDLVRAGRGLPNEALYYNAAFDGSGGSDLLLQEWKQLDPADTLSPTLERYLFFRRQEDRLPEVEALFLQAQTRSKTLERPASDEEWLRQMKRRYFFEGRLLPDQAEATPLPSPAELLPYRYFQEFQAALTVSEIDHRLLGRLLHGIARADGVPDHVLTPGLFLRMNDGTADDLVIVKRFPEDDFCLQRGGGGPVFIESLADRLTLRHKSGSPALIISLDMFEFLMRAEEGFLAGPEEQRALAEDLGNFKNQLLARPTTDVRLVEPSGRAHAARVKNGRIVVGRLA